MSRKLSCGRGQAMCASPMQALAPFNESPAYMAALRTLQVGVRRWIPRSRRQKDSGKQRASDRVGFASDNGQERARGTGRDTSAMLPVFQCALAQAEQPGEFTLR